MDMQGALEGVKVLDLSRMLPGPYCSMILADHGAEVISIEDHRFKEDGLFFNDLNRNKRHMSLNLKTSKGKEIFFKLTKQTDVILEGFRPGVVKRLGIDYPTVKEINPRVIYCSISGYGQTGGASNRVGHDVNYLSMAGVLGLIGEKERLPSIPGVQVADIAGGAMNGAIGILLALCAREKTGQGQYIDISMTDGMLGFLSLPNYFSTLTGRQPQAADTMLSHRYGCYNTYETKDGRYLSIGAVENRFWKPLCEHFHRLDYISLQYDEEKREEIIAFFRQRFLTKTLSEWEDELGELEICYARVQTVQEVFADPLFREREMVFEYTDKQGSEKSSIGIPVKLSATPGSLRTVPDEFGESTRDILLETGYSREQVESFFHDGIV
jgi:crotonobetainyl-CoA:carnitine CoA-transferase CaiB-like acyl-CoA transferase